MNIIIIIYILKFVKHVEFNTDENIKDNNKNFNNNKFDNNLRQR